MECLICQMKFKRKSNYSRHLMSKIHERNNHNKSDLFICTCGKKYLYKQSLSRHQMKCKEYKEYKYSKSESNNEKEIGDEETSVPNNEYTDDGKNIRITNDFKSITTNNIGTQNNISNNIENVTIQINAFGCESLEHISDRVLVKCINSAYKSIPSLIEKIHFDPNFPGNKNVQITNKKLQYAKVMGVDNTWKTVDRSETIEKLVDKGYNILDESYSELKNHVFDGRSRYFERFQNEYTSQSKDLLRELKKEVDLLVLNSSRI